jgi:hypothetical protein
MRASLASRICVRSGSGIAWSALDFIRCGFDLGTQITGARNRIDAGGRG